MQPLSHIKTGFPLELKPIGGNTREADCPSLNNPIANCTSSKQKHRNEINEPRNRKKKRKTRLEEKSLKVDVLLRLLFRFQKRSFTVKTVPCLRAIYLKKGEFVSQKGFAKRQMRITTNHLCKC